MTATSLTFQAKRVFFFFKKRDRGRWGERDREGGERGEGEGK